MISKNITEALLLEGLAIILFLLESICIIDTYKVYIMIIYDPKRPYWFIA